MNNVYIKELEEKILNHFDYMDSEYIDNEMIYDFLSPYEILLLICFICDMKKIKFEILDGTKKNQHIYDNKIYAIPQIKIVRKED